MYFNFQVLVICLIEKTSSTYHLFFNFQIQQIYQIFFKLRKFFDRKCSGVRNVKRRQRSVSKQV